ncbi:MAG: hypothetical protein PVG15_13465 [Desulfobacterales bacterium]
MGEHPARERENGTGKLRRFKTIRITVKIRRQPRINGLRQIRTTGKIIGKGTQNIVHATGFYKETGM